MLPGQGMVNVCRRISWPAVHQLDLFLCSNVASLRRQLTFTSVPSHDISLTRADRVATLEEAKAQFQESWDAWKDHSGRLFDPIISKGSAGYTPQPTAAAGLW